MQVANVVGPVVLVMLLGSLLRRSNLFDARAFSAMNSLTYRVGLPALLVVKTATLKPDLAGSLRIFYVIATVALACIVISFSLAHLLGLARPRRAAFVQGAYRGNISFVGLSILFYAAQEPSAGSRLETLGLLTLGLTVPCYNALAVFILASSDASQQLSPIKVLRRIITNPLLVASLLGLAFSLLPLPFPPLLLRTGEALGQMSLPLALLGIGAGLDLGALSRSMWLPLAATVIKLVAAPLLGLALGTWMGLSVTERQVALVLLATPTASAAFIMAEQMGADAQLTTHIIILSTMLSAFSLAFTLWHAF